MRSSDPSFYYLFGRIDEHAAMGVINWLLEMNSSPEPWDKLTLVINSDGGGVNSASAIVDAIIGSEAPVHTVGTGSLMSSALIAFLAGDKRTITPSTTIMSHQWSIDLPPMKAHDIEAYRRQAEATNNRQQEFLMHVTGLSAEEVATRLLPPSDVWLTPQEALKLKICHHVDYLTPRKRSIS
jgi:ATP-dependent protease ClpP protease subunit